MKNLKVKVEIAVYIKQYKEYQDKLKKNRFCFDAPPRLSPEALHYASYLYRRMKYQMERFNLGILDLGDSK